MTEEIFCVDELSLSVRRTDWLDWWLANRWWAVHIRAENVETLEPTKCQNECLQSDSFVLNVKLCGDLRMPNKENSWKYARNARKWFGFSCETFIIWRKMSSHFELNQYWFYANFVERCVLMRTFSRLSLSSSVRHPITITLCVWTALHSTMIGGQEHDNLCNENK